MKIGVDIMGGDHAPEETVRGAILAQKILDDSDELVLIGNQSKIEQELEYAGASTNDFEIVHASDIITMNDHPTRALPKKPNSTIAKGFSLLKSNEIHGFASAGNTGAMLVASMYSINPVPGIIRPCITSILPRLDGNFNLILDVGSNPDCKPDVLYQFAHLGSLYAQHVFGLKDPQVRLLNIGEEEQKGNLLTQAAYKLMNGASDFNFGGNIEAYDIFGENSDVVVCDGFSGNIVLKLAEGIYSLLKQRGVNDEYFDTFNYENYGGTPVLGVNGNVIIGHGVSSKEAIKNMIILTKDVTESELDQKIREAFE